MLEVPVSKEKLDKNHMVINALLRVQKATHSGAMSSVYIWIIDNCLHWSWIWRLLHTKLLLNLITIYHLWHRCPTCCLPAVKELQVPSCHCLWESCLQLSALQCFMGLVVLQQLAWNRHSQEENVNNRYRLQISSMHLWRGRVESFRLVGGAQTKWAHFFFNNTICEPAPVASRGSSIGFWLEGMSGA